MLISGKEIAAELLALDLTHVIWVPDSVLGQWEAALDASPITLLRVCREGEAWPLAAGLITAGQRPIVLMQSTGLFESGDALRNVAFDLKLPVFAVVGVRNWFNGTTSDSAREFAKPILDAWGLDYVFLESADQRHLLREHYGHCRDRHTPGAVLLAE